jgi:hypothetical protein
MEMTNLWAWRDSVTHGYRWVKERECKAGDANSWHTIFRKDEPHIQFRVSKVKPKPIF